MWLRNCFCCLHRVSHAEGKQHEKSPFLWFTGTHVSCKSLLSRGGWVFIVVVFPGFLVPGFAGGDHPV